MDDLGFNKIAGAVLATGLGIMILMKLPAILMPDADESIAYKVGPIETTTVEADVDLPFPQADWVAAMDAAKGAKVFKKCTSCHNVEDGGANGTGPNLYAVVGADKASHADYSYSAALDALPGEWTYENLDGYLEKPSAYAPGTKMNFIGLKKPADRAAVIEYLRVNGSQSLAKPEPAVAELEISTPLEEPIVETEQSMEEPPVDVTDETVVEPTE
ncbi:c-type cytochrome [Litorimonas sp. WD9-15]|uniref:c-type cytochrome n=1 Tax=Litorimonas sp. WD9-15 TaxID=3418716 RepID=UPI003D034F98